MIVAALNEQDEGSRMKVITDDKCTSYQQPGHPERPARITMTVEKLRTQTEIPIQWVNPEPAPNVALLRAHTQEHLERLSEPMDFDADTPYFPNIAERARASAGAALAALNAARAGEPAFSLMRPPGHHATRTEAMGFCYLSHMAIATLEALATGAERGAVFQFFRA